MLISKHAGNLSRVHVSQQHEMEFHLWSILTSGINWNCSYCDIVCEPTLTLYSSTGNTVKYGTSQCRSHKIWQMENQGLGNTCRMWASAPPWGTKWYSIENLKKRKKVISLRRRWFSNHEFNKKKLKNLRETQKIYSLNPSPSRFSSLRGTISDSSRGICSQEAPVLVHILFDLILLRPERWSSVNCRIIGILCSKSANTIV